MGVFASAGYQVTHPDGTEELIEVEESSDTPGYSPDVAADLMTRVQEGLAKTYAATWPAVTPTE